MEITKFIDCHTHVNFAAFKDDYKETIARAYEAGVFLVNVGTQKDTSRRAVEMAHEFPNGVYATVGVHPIHTDKSHHDADELGATDEAVGFTSREEEFDYEYYKKLAMDDRVVAIGECGIDLYRIENQKSKITKQRDVFEKHIELAREVKKPLMIHCRSGAPERASPQNVAGREAYGELTEILNSNVKTLNNPSGIIHFFCGAKEEARKLLDLGFYFTFGGVVTFSRDYDEVVKYIPMERILSETDAPYVTPVPYRGKRNEPTYVVEVVKKLAELKGVSLDEMKSWIWGNVHYVLTNIPF